MTRLSSIQLSIILNAASLVGTTVATSVMGAVYWVVAARQFSSTGVGFAATATSAMALLGTIGSVGLGSLLIAELPRHPKRAGSLISTSLVVALAVSALLGIMFAIVAPRLAGDLQPLATGWGGVTLFSLGAGLTAVSLVLDQALVGLLRGTLQFARNLIFAGAKLTFLVAIAWFVPGDGVAIFGTWVAGIAASLIALAGWAMWFAQSAGSYRPQWSLRRTLWRGALRHHALNLALQTPSFALPLIVTIILSIETTAHFYAAWMIVGMLSVGSRSLAAVLFAVGAQEPKMLAQHLRFTLSIAVAVGIASSIVLVAGAVPLLRVFGSDYAREAGLSLRLLGIGILPLVIRDHYAALCRIHGHLLRAAKLVSIGGVLELGLAAIGGIVWGLAGLSVGWLVAVTLESFFMVNTVYRATRCNAVTVPCSAQLPEYTD